jgi:hypothetical protein
MPRRSLSSAAVTADGLNDDWDDGHEDASHVTEEEAKTNDHFGPREGEETKRNVKMPEPLSNSPP